MQNIRDNFKNEAQKQIRKRNLEEEFPLPRCEICNKEMFPPTKIFNCKQGHTACQHCKADLNSYCTICQDPEGFNSRCRYAENVMDDRIKRRRM